MTGAVIFDRWTPRGAEITFELEGGGVWSTIAANMAVERQTDGSALVEAFGMIYRLTPSGPKGEAATVQ